jgi:DNA-binding MarR family transcriptional regulator
VKDNMSKRPPTAYGRASWLDQSPTRLVGDVFDAQTKEHDLTPRQVAVLTTVAENEGLSQTGIVDCTGIDRSTLADLVRRLKLKGLLERRRTKEDAPPMP